jgi:hypothetical protein
MKAIVYWRPAYPVPGCTEGGQHTHTTACWKPWENGTYESTDEFQEPPRLSITAPVLANYGNRFKFDDAVPGVCEIHAKGTTGDASLDAGLTWSISAMNGSTVTIVPDTGTDVTIKYTTLPPNITDFGFKTITLSHPSMPGATTTAQVEIYFLVNKKVGEDIRTVTNWPGVQPVVPWYSPGTPAHISFAEDNSYHYYSQVEGASLHCPWYKEGSCTRDDLLPYPPYFERYVPQIGPLATGFTKADYFDERSGTYIKWAGQTLWGINLFAWAARHERRHHVDWDYWYGEGGMDPRPEDADNDMIRDPFEPVIPVAEGGPYNPINNKTHSGLGPYYGIDGEAHAEFSHETNWEIREQDNEEDWGYPGSRWHP